MDKQPSEFSKKAAHKQEAEKKVAAAAARLKSSQLLGLFEANPQRFNELSVNTTHIRADFSKNHIDRDCIDGLWQLLQAKGFTELRSQLFAGAIVNNTEQRAALHTLLRTPSEKVSADNQANGELIKACKSRMAELVVQIQDGHWRGFSGKAITDIVNIGIGGSDLGPRMVYHALRDFHHPTLRCHFVANVDSADFYSCVNTLDPETTVFIVCSKTFTTQETLSNAELARNWLERGGAAGDYTAHFIAVSTNIDAAKQFGCREENILPMWDWVGGRFSLWSAIGLSIALGTSMESFNKLCAGAHAMDEHFFSASYETNLPVLLAMIGYFYRVHFATGSHAILPYADKLALLPDFLQQLEMESNGKCVARDGSAATEPTAPVIWGSVGTNGQHSFYQLLHQGSTLIPVDFIAVAKSSKQDQQAHLKLLANCIAQSRALMVGKSTQEILPELLAQGMTEEQAQLIARHKTMPGNRPSTTLVLDQLTPESLGALIALYEHKVFTQSVLWDINPFDQWGVELGKKMGIETLSMLESKSSTVDTDPSTAKLVEWCKPQD